MAAEAAEYPCVRSCLAMAQQEMMARGSFLTCWICQGASRSVCFSRCRAPVSLQIGRQAAVIKRGHPLADFCWQLRKCLRETKNATATTITTPTTTTTTTATTTTGTATTATITITITTATTFITITTPQLPPSLLYRARTCPMLKYKFWMLI